MYSCAEPLGLELVAQAARCAGHSTRLTELQVESHTEYHRTVKEWQPDVVAFFCNYLVNIPEIVDLAKATKLALPRSLLKLHRAVECCPSRDDG
ncbi:MAG: cobalamin B12-binding domain-containing protein [Xanthobacteraceae bacterium]